MTIKSNGEKKLSDYPDPKKASMVRWAWEFLRRNPEYRKDIAEYLAACDSIVPDFNPLHPPDVTIEEHNRLYSALMDDERHHVYDPPRESGETEGAWIRRANGSITPLDNWYAKKWSLDRLFHPDDKWELLWFSPFKKNATTVSTAGPGWDGFGNPETGRKPDRSRDAFIIDYKLPLKPQLDAIKEYAVKHKEYLQKKGEISSWPEKRGQDYLLYLQILDALQEISSTEFEDQKKIIGDKFYPETEDDKPSYKRRKAGGEAIKSALKLRDNDYIYLPMMTKKVTR